MSKFRAAAFGAVVFVGMAVAAGAQAPAKTDSARTKVEGPRRERVEGQRKMRMERGMRQPGMQRGMRQRGMRQGMRQGQFGPGMHRGGEFGARIELTDAQKTSMKTIREKYAPQFKALRETSATQMKALRDARQKGDTSAAMRQRFQAEREQIRTRSNAIRLQQQNEMRGVLTAEQRTKVDAAREAQAKRIEDQVKVLQERAKALRAR